MGKTALAINIAEHVALNEGLPVAVFSMEMGAAQLAVRIVGSIGRIDQSHLRTGKLTDEEWPRLTEAIEKLRTISLHIDESAGLTSGELRANARRLSRQCGQLGLIVVAYLQLMSGSRGSDGENRATELGEISRGLKMLAKELKCPVIALSQLNRSVESRPDKRPVSYTHLDVYKRQVQDIGSCWHFKGFLTTPKGARYVVFHVQEFVKE